MILLFFLIPFLFIPILIIQTLGLINPKLFILKRYRKESRIFFVLQISFTVITLSSIIFFYEYKFKLNTNNEEVNNYKINSEMESLTSLEYLKKKYISYPKKENIFDINKEIMNEVNGSKSILISPTLKFNFSLNNKKDISKIKILAKFTNDKDNKIKTITTISAIIYSININIYHENSAEILNKIIEEAKIFEQNGINFNEYRIHNILYKISYIPEKFLNLEITKEIDFENITL